MVPRGAPRAREPERHARPGLWLEEGDRVVAAAARAAARDEADADGARRRRRCASAPPACRWSGASSRSPAATESHAEEAVQPLYARVGAAAVPIAATILASLGQIELHLSARAATRADAEAALDAAVAATSSSVHRRRRLQHRRPAARGGRRRSAASTRGLRIAVAESCTGGLLTSRLTDVPGSSRYVDRAVVAYSNEAKIELLGVPAGADRRARRRQRTGGAGDGRGHPRARAASTSASASPASPGPAAARRRSRSARWRSRSVTARTTRVADVPVRRRAASMVKFQASQAALDMVRRMLTA